MKGRTRIFAIMVATALIMASVCHLDSGMAVQAATKKAGSGMYTITSEKKKEARFDRLSKKNIKSLSIPATVKIGKVKYKVVSIKANALAKTKIKKLVIGKNVKKIGKKAFYNCRNLKSITIKSKKLTSIGKKAFGKLNSKAVVTLPKLSDSKVKSYERMLRGGGLTGKNQMIKPNKPASTSSPNKPVTIPDPEVRFAIGELEGGVKNPWVNTAVDATYAVGDMMTFSMFVRTPYEMYGSWSIKKKKVSTNYDQCNCGKLFDINTNNLAIHFSQTGHSRSLIVPVTGETTVPMWYWTPDNTPCKVVYHITLPAGLTANEDSIEVWRYANAQISQTDGKYVVQVSGQDVTITINNIKPIPYRKSDNGTVFPIVVKVSAKLNENAADVNQVDADITYNYGSGDKIINMNPVTIRKQ